MKVLIVHKDSLSSKRKKEIETARTFLEKYTPVEWEFTYKRDRDLVKNLVLEDGDNLDEHSIKEYLDSPEYDIIHLDVTDSTWKKLGLRKTLYGQAEYISGQGITYGRWTERNKDYVKKLPTHLQFLSEVGLGIIHEIAHIMRAKYKMKYSAHSYFYGYSELQLSKDRKEKPSPRRWAKKPNPDKFFESVPFAINTPALTDTPPPSSTLKPMLEEKYWDNVTQDFLNPNSLYKVTGVHIGVDFGCPEWTPVYAPFDGTLTRREVNHPVLGNCGYYLFFYQGKYWAVRFAHLVTAPIAGDYKQGDIIGYTGNTGLSTGAHLHIVSLVLGATRSVEARESLVRFQ